MHSKFQRQWRIDTIASSKRSALFVSNTVVFNWISGVNGQPAHCVLGVGVCNKVYLLMISLLPTLLHIMRARALQNAKNNTHKKTHSIV